MANELQFRTSKDKINSVRKMVIARLIPGFVEHLSKQVSTVLLYDLAACKDVQLIDQDNDCLVRLSDTLEQNARDAFLALSKEGEIAKLRLPAKVMQRSNLYEEYFHKGMGNDIDFLVGMYGVFKERLDEGVMKHKDKTWVPSDRWQLADSLEIEVAVLRDEVSKLESELQNGKQMQKNYKALKKTAKASNEEAQLLKDELQTARAKVSVMRGSLDEAKAARIKAEKQAADLQYEMELQQRRHELELKELREKTATGIRFEDLFKREGRDT